jgi:hypothetical protein
MTKIIAEASAVLVEKNASLTTESYKISKSQLVPIMLTFGSQELPFRGWILRVN